MRIAITAAAWTFVLASTSIEVSGLVITATIAIAGGEDFKSLFN